MSETISIKMTAGYHVEALIWNLSRPEGERDGQMQAEAHALMLFALYELNGNMSIPIIDGDAFFIGESSTGGRAND